MQPIIETATLEQIKPLRFAILRPNEKDSSNCEYEGDRDAKALHFRMLLGGSAIGMISVLPSAKLFEGFGETQSRIRGLGTLPKYRNLGYGRSLLLHAILFSKHNNLMPTWGSGREHLLDFYSSIGAVPISTAYEIRGTGDHLDFIIEK